MIACYKILKFAHTCLNIQLITYALRKLFGLRERM